MGLTSEILKPFNKADSELLAQVDLACAAEAKRLMEEASRASLAGEEYKVDVETLAWSRIIKAYGILYNRAIDAGWVEGVLTENK